MTYDKIIDKIIDSYLNYTADEYYDRNKQNDPKQVLRAAFAKSGRVVQFLNYESQLEDTVKDANHQKNQ